MTPILYRSHAVVSIYIYIYIFTYIRTDDPYLERFTSKSSSAVRHASPGDHRRLQGLG